MNLFWSRWKKEYIQTLQTRAKWIKPKRNFHVGDVILMKDERTTRNHWPLALITDVLTDKKGLVRFVTVKTGSTTLERPIDKLIK